MYIGNLQHLAQIAFYHACTDVAFTPDCRENDLYFWKWQSVFDTALDVQLQLPRPCYIGSVTVKLADGSAVRDALVLSGGKPVGRFTAETGRDISGTVTIPVGIQAEVLTLRLTGNLKDIAFPMPEIAGAFDDGDPFLWPTPAKADFLPGTVRIREILCAHPEDADEQAAADFLQERLTERFGSWRDENGVSVTVAKDTSGSFDAERYLVQVTESGITLRAGDRLPLHFAADALLQMGHDADFRLGAVDDRPAKPMRGFHIMLPAADQIDFAKRVFRYVLIPLRYNQLIVEFAGGMRFDRHPEISESWIEGNRRAKQGLQPPFPHSCVADGECLEKAQVRDLLDTARGYGIDIIPEVQSLGHVQYITYSHPEIAELEENANTVKDTRAEDARPSEFYAHSYCPSLQASYDLIYDILDEILEVARPQHFVHMGHDEIYQLGICPRCKGKDPAGLYAKHITAMHDYLAKRGLRMMIWSDGLHSTERYKTWPAVHTLPRDIIMLDFIWYFHFDLDMEDHILPYGYDVMMGNLYSSHYPRYESRAAKAHMIGGEVSTWCLFNEFMLAKKGKFWDLAYTAEMLWSPDYSERFREVYSMLLSRYVQPLQRAELRGTYRPEGYTSTVFFLPKLCSRSVPPAVKTLRPESVPADGASVPVSGCYDRLIFEHTTVTNAPRVAWEDLKVLGAYTVRYADGTEEELPVRYAGNILCWNRRYGQPLPQQYYRHQGYIGTWYLDPAATGKSDAGEDVLIGGYLWENPHPEKEIAEVRYQAVQDCTAPVILCGLRGEKKIR